MSLHRATGPRHRARAHPARRRSRRARLLRTLLILTAVLVLGGGAAAWYLYRELDSIGSSAALGPDAPKSTDGSTNILLMGLDTRKDQNGDELPHDVLKKLHAGSSEIGGYNANTLILLHVPAGGGKAKGFSIPRDDLVDIPGHGKDKIKKAYGLAKADEEERLLKRGVKDRHELEQAGREAGRRSQIETVRTFLGVPVDHFAEVNLAGFYHLADALGGVEVCLNHPVEDRYSGADFPAGKQKLNAQEALAFVRQRHGLTRGDLDRTRRQQAFLASALHQANSLGTLTNPGRLLDLKDVVKENVVLDKGWGVLSFVKEARSLTGGNVEFTTLPVESFAKHNGEDVNIVDRDLVRRRVQEQTGQLKPAHGARKDGGGEDSGHDDPKVSGGGVPCVD
ncbi:LCP family protein [Streptomyces formicae]|uniref:Cell envelope-associated transcriptional attenuator LytR-CpsA-Psr n=1 Tax=Streptomyces formicae TaxID=1616117 RepID=A0A291Q329_9ACTN|nr:LCP family protein [Streptomyces formicae]ATL25896.1 Cell envelope-associated transcriptional attenuator LytR-CpsA-Psr [Streptomyces formicae]